MYLISFVCGLISFVLVTLLPDFSSLAYVISDLLVRISDHNLWMDATGASDGFCFALLPLGALYLGDSCFVCRGSLFIVNQYSSSFLFNIYIHSYIHSFDIVEFDCLVLPPACSFTGFYHQIGRHEESVKEAYFQETQDSKNQLHNCQWFVHRSKYICFNSSNQPRSACCLYTVHVIGSR